jgi:hypothetical protein
VDGGGTSADSGYALQGAIGHPDAGDLQGSGYTLRGGFWGNQVPTPTVTATSQATAIATQTATSQATATPTWTATQTPTPLPGSTSTPTPSATPPASMSMMKIFLPLVIRS